MTKITDTSQLKVGDEVTITVKGRISHVYNDPDDSYANLDYEYHAEYIPISNESLDAGLITVERNAPPLPTENGVYVPAYNAESPEGSYLYIYDEENEDGPWTQFNGNTAMTGLAAKEEAEHAHNRLGGLVPLVPKS